MTALVAGLLAIQLVEVVVIVAMTVRAWSRLPERIPTRWRTDGTDVQYGSRGVVLLMPCVASGLAALFASSAGTTPRNGPPYAAPLAGIILLAIMIVAQRRLLAGPRNRT